MGSPNINEVQVVNELLTNVAIGYTNPTIIGLQIFPAIPVGKEAGTFFTFSGQEIYNQPESLRGPSSKYNKIEWKTGTDTYAAKEYGLEKDIDDRVRANSQLPISLDVKSTELLTGQLLLNLEQRIADIITDTTNYAAANTTTLAGPDQWNNKVSDVLSKIESAKYQIVKTIGLNPNVCIISRQVWKWLKQHPQLLDAVKYVQKAQLTGEQVASLFEVDTLLIGSALKKSSNPGQTTITKAFVWGQDVILAYINQSPVIDQPSFGYTFTARNVMVERYRDESIKSDVIRASHVVSEKLTMADAGYLIKSAVANV